MFSAIIIMRMFDKYTKETYELTEKSAATE
jgi:hypothetical protein